VQEIQSAQNIQVICGKRELEFRILELVVLLSQATEKRTGNSILLKPLNEYLLFNFTFHLRQPIRLLFDWRNESWGSLSRALQDYATFICTDPRDRIYALLNICQPIDIPVDYTITSKDLFEQSTGSIIEQDNKLDIIFRKPLPKQRSEYSHQVDTASWVPKYELELSSGSLCFAWDRKNYFYDAGGPLQGKVAFADKGVLKVCGHFFTLVHSVLQTSDLQSSTKGQLWESILSIRSQLGLGRNSKMSAVSRMVTQLRHKKKSTNICDANFWKTLVIDTYTIGGNWYQRISKNDDAAGGFENEIRTCLISKPTNTLLFYIRHGLDGKGICVLQNKQ
jgi:hypothetical protein